MTETAVESTQPRTVGVLLAGGRSQRMGGGDKALRPLGGRPMLAHAIARARPQVAALVLNANGDPARFASFGLPVAADTVDGFAGPLAGVLAGMEWAAAHVPDAPWLASFATDAPFFPRDLVERLHAVRRRDDAEMACARSDGREQPVFALWPVRLASELRRALADGLRKVDTWAARYRRAAAVFEPVMLGAQPVDPFFNVNGPEDLAAAAALLGRAHL